MSSMLSVGLDCLQHIFSYCDAAELVALDATCKFLHTLEIDDVDPSVAEWLTFHRQSWYKKFSERIRQIPQVHFYGTTDLLDHLETVPHPKTPLPKRLAFNYYEQILSDPPRQFSNTLSRYLEDHNDLLIPLEVILFLSKTWSHAVEFFKQDLEVHLADAQTLQRALKHRGYLLKYAPKSHQDSIEMRKRAFQDNPYWQFLFEEPPDTFEENMSALKRACHAYPLLCEQPALSFTLFSDTGFTQLLLQANPYYIEKVHNSPTMSLELLQTFTAKIKEWPNTYQKYDLVRRVKLPQVLIPEEVFKELIEIAPSKLQEAPPSLQNNQEYILSLSKKHYDILRYCPTSLQQNHDFCFKMLNINQGTWRSIFLSNPTIGSDPRFLSFAIERKMTAFVDEIEAYNNRSWLERLGVTTCLEGCMSSSCLCYVPLICSATVFALHEYFQDEE